VQCAPAPGDVAKDSRDRFISMTFLRRGNVAFPHRPNAQIRLHRSHSLPWTIWLKDISCFEEFEYRDERKIVIVYFTNGSNFAVIEGFDTVMNLCREWEVANV